MDHRMPYSLEQLTVLSQVVASGSFSAAARRLGKTQSAISTAIANLEIDLGLTLFDRASKVPTLTPAGEQVLHQAEAVIEQCRVLTGHAQSLSVGAEAMLTLAIEVPYGPLMPPLKEFEKRFPFVELNLRHPQHGDVSRLVLSGEVQLGVAVAQQEYPRELGFSRMGNLVMVHVVGRQHPLRELATVTFIDLHNHRRLAFRAHRETLPTSEYLRAPRCWQAENYSALIEMARAGLGWASLPRQMITPELQAGELVELRLDAYPHTEWLLGVDLIWRKAGGLGQAGRWLRERLGAEDVWEGGR
jgi:DNA-binding transcriptional LysR family regulator